MMTGEFIVDPFDSKTWTDDERFYFEYVDEMLASGSDIGISNGKPIHAVYLLASFLSHASRAVRLFSGTMSRKTTGGDLEIYGNSHVAEAAEVLLSRPSSTMTIVLEKNIDVDEGQSAEDHPLVSSIKNLKESGRLKGRFEVRKITDERLNWLREKEICHHLMVMDEKAYRLETDTDFMKAYVNFGDAKNARMLADLFDKFISRDSEPLMIVS